MHSWCFAFRLTHVARCDVCRGRGVATRRVASTGYSPRATLHRSCRSRGTAGVEKENEGDETGGGTHRQRCLPLRGARSDGGGYTRRRNKGFAGIAPDKELTIRRGWARTGEMCSESLANDFGDYGI